LRNMKFPSTEKLVRMGRTYGHDMSQEVIDELVRSA